VNRTRGVSKLQVYDGLLDIEAANCFRQGLVGIERMDDGLIQVENHWKEYRKIFGQVATEYFEVVEFNEQDKIALRCNGIKGTNGKMTVGIFKLVGPLMN
jgi:hypothetical protein